MKSQFFLAIKLCWIIFGTMSSLTIISVYILPENIIMHLTPVCQQKKITGMDCPTCGLSRGFMNISNGNIEEAIELNKSSLIIFSLFILNSFFFFSFLFYKIYFKFIILRKSDNKLREMKYFNKNN